MQQFASRLKSSRDKEAKRLGTDVEQLCVGSVTIPAVPSDSAAAFQPEPTPAPAGSASILESLKRLLGMQAGAAEQPTTLLDPDQFPLSANSPLQQEHRWLSELFGEVVGTYSYTKPKLTDCHSGRALLAKDPATAGRVALAAAERHIQTLIMRSMDYTDHRLWQSHYAAAGIIEPVMQIAFEVDRNEVFDLVLYLSVSPPQTHVGLEATTEKLIARAELERSRSPLTEGERYVLSLFRASLLSGPALGAPSTAVTRISRLINNGANFYLVPGEAWSDELNRDLTSMNVGNASDWTALLKHALSATSARPSAKWLATGRKLVDAIGGDDVRQALARWLPLVAQGQTIRKLGNYSGDTRGAGDVMNEENATALRGLIWLVQVIPRSGELVRALTVVAQSAYRKVPGVGPRAVKVGNAAVYALSEMGSTDAVGQLAVLKVRVKFGTAQKEIEKAFTTAAEALELPRDQIEEMGVPSYGMDEVGLYRESLGDYRAELIVSGSNAELR
jgi:hypothetical protein